jgi:hypothetical protein
LNFQVVQITLSLKGLNVIPDKKEGETDNKDGGDDKAKGDKKEDKKKDKSDKKKEEKKAKKEPKKPKIETIKEPLEFEITLLDRANMSAELKKASKDKLEALANHDREKKARLVLIHNPRSEIKLVVVLRLTIC